MTLTLSRLFHQFVLSWQRQEEKRREKEKMDDSIYRYKSRVHGDERDNDVIEEEEFQQQFPSYNQVNNFVLFDFLLHPLYILYIESNVACIGGSPSLT